MLLSNEDIKVRAKIMIDFTCDILKMKKKIILERDTRENLCLFQIKSQGGHEDN